MRWFNGLLIQAPHLNMAWWGTTPSIHDPLRTLKTKIIAGGQPNWLALERNEARETKTVVNKMFPPDVVGHAFNPGP